MRFKGIVHITGEHDTGKTLMALGATHPKKTVFFHNDVKSPGIDPSEFGLYIDLVSKKLTYLQTKDYVLEEIDKIKPGQFDGIVFDTWTRIGEAFIHHGRMNATKFRESETMATDKKWNVYRSGQEWKEGRLYEASFISDLNQLVPYVCLVTHLKDYYRTNVKTDKQIPDCSDSLDRICNLRVWLRHNPDSGVPIALVLKRPSLTKVTKDGLEVVDYLPRKLTPDSDQSSIWDVIDWYRDNPYSSFHEIEKGEIPTPYELSILDGILTDDQKEVWRANLEHKEEIEEFEQELEDSNYEEFKAKVLELKDKPLPLIFKTIQEEFNGAYDMAQIKEIKDETN